LPTRCDRSYSPCWGSASVAGYRPWRPRRVVKQAADAVEARLLSGEVRLAVWSELAERRNQVTEVACRVGDSHFQDMARLFEEAAEKGRGLRRQRGWADAAQPPVGMGGPLVSVSGRAAR